MENQKSQKYFLGLDIGTNSVGWCVTDENYNVMFETLVKSYITSTSEINSNSLFLIYYSFL